MRRTLALLLILFTLLGVKTRAQTAQVTGSVKDTINQSIPANTVILLLRPVDTNMVAFTRADAKGAFHFSGLPAGDYLIWISHPAFAPYRDSIHLVPGPNDLGGIFLTLRSQILKEVIIKGVNPIRMKGDTVEFTADSFAVRPGATAEDLLKRLPGIQVDKNGKITAQGQTVQKVLVDGEEFFGDDPTIATRNIAASAVDKVQVFDKKSDQAAFTGIDDGQTTKTINLKLKNGKKNGYFGKISGGLGTDGYYENTAAANFFKNKRKLSFFGVAANTGKTGLNMTDNTNYSSSGISTVNDGGDMMFFFSGSNDDFTNWNGSYSGQGVPIAWNAGAHYNNKFDDDKISLGGDYIFNQVQVGVNNNTVSLLTLPDSTTNKTTSNTFSRYFDRQHSLSARYDVQLDSLNEIKVTAQGKMRHKTTFEQDTSFAVNQDSALINNAGTHKNIIGDNNTFNSTLLWQHKTHKKGRTLSFSAQENYTEINSTGNQYSLVNSYEGGPLQSVDTTDQYKTSYSRDLTLLTKLTYTEPLFNNTYLSLDYGVNLLSATSDVNAYNKNAGGKYSLLDSAYSNFYNLNILTNAGGAFFRKSTKKYNYALGSDVGYTSYKQDNIYQDLVRNRDFINWYPKANFSYRSGGSTYFGINYNGNTTQPSLDQLQPVANNNNPLNIVEGNPNLKPSFTNRVNMNYNKYNVLADRGMFFWGGYTFTSNAFSNKDSVDKSGKTYSQTVNVNNSQNGNLGGGYNFRWKKPDLHFFFGPNIGYNKYTNYVNGLLNNTQSGNYGLALGTNKRKEKVYEFDVRFNATYNTSKSSIQSSSNINYWTYEFNGDASKDLPWKFLLATDWDMNFYQKTTVFTNKNIALVNVSLQKSFFKNNDLVLKATVNDLFNQNTGFTRSVTTNLATQSVYTAIHRYMMFSVTWNFAKNGKPKDNPWGE
ncbi:TonB-dependent receptor [Dinghuibacter silviterrae]|uniref:Carboxypeptidase family protein n=1 Tax=Dinghuibacter silviterrae TaxID=1539049 RepID=A0A4R8DS02_9BACT|nr:TonB-dependent receptor [Dinghuibacter silviterrae]TDX01014.1 carboxypeptidase family protein [Dinghuibacter silviterrae]